MNPIKHLRDERGIALPVALAVLFVVAGLATVAVRAAITVDHQTLRDRNAKAAIQAAVSGIQEAVYQTNLMQPQPSQCVIKDSTGQLTVGGVGGSGWCAATTEDLGNGASYTEQVSSGTTITVNSVTVVQRKVASTGTANGVVRRALYTINAATGAQLFPTGYAALTQNSISMKNNAKITGGLASNGNITLKNNSNVCGNITAGPGKTYSHGQNTTVCGGYSTTNATQPFAIQPVDLSAATPNDNVRITNAISGSGSNKDSCSNTCNKISWNSTTRVLTINSGGVLTLSGNTYFLCRIQVNGNGTFQINARTTPMKMYIDTPEHCGSTSGMGSVSFASTSTFSNPNSDPTMFQLYVAGSPTIATSIDLSGNDNNGAAALVMVVYGPNSSLTYQNNMNFTGAIVAKSLDIKNNAVITYDSRVTGISSGSSTRFYQGYDYKECTGAPTGSTPDTGC